MAGLLLQGCKQEMVSSARQQHLPSLKARMLRRWALARGAPQLPGASNILPLPCWLQPGGYSGSASAAPNPVGVPAWASCVLPWLIMATGQLGARPTHSEPVTPHCSM